MTSAARSGRWSGWRRWRAARSVAAAALLSTLGAGAALGAEAPADPAPPVSERGLKGFVTVDRPPAAASAVLAGGRMVWGEDRRSRQGGHGLTGAPKITSAGKWRKRVAEGPPVLFQRAKEGFLGPTYKETPARGGNPELTDEQGEATVAFMVWISGGVAAVETWLQQENQSRKGV